MKQNILYFTLILALLAAVVAYLPLARAQVGNVYELAWSAVDSGGGASSGGDYTLNSALGQPAAGTMSGGEYTLVGGLGLAIEDELHKIYLPFVVR